MKYLSLSTVENSFKSSVVKTSIEFWTLLGVLQSIDGELKSGITYKFLMAKTASFLGRTFTLSDTYNGISDNEKWYAKFGYQWDKEIKSFMKQGKVANIYELAIWALRKEEFEDKADLNTVLQVFVDRFHFSLETLTNLFSHDTVTCEFEDKLYSDTNLKDFIKSNYSQDNDFDNLRPDGKLIQNAADVVQAGAFIKPFFNKLYNNRCLMITTFDVELEFSSNSQKEVFHSSLPLQQIFYGAPGTGKSHGINEQTKGKSVIRTTFHPDSDYSTFVGCYKPTKEYVGKKLNKNLSFQDLANILNGYYNDPDNGHIGGLQKFAYEYVSYLNGDIMNVNVTQLLQQAGVGTSYNVEINKYVEFCTLLPKRKESRITYEFVAQAFTKAYVLAWQEYLKGSEKPVVLIIEEINRGNCAQIFGDLFQLLDRSDDGFSSYPIKSDTDLGNFIAEEMSGFDSQEYASIINGDELLLPPNLYIWATMNTSDQSLFPIDSAFKRRWDWVYIPINIEAKTGWHIDVNDKKYKWSSFLEKINNEIEVTTSSEDKQLGFFFCKAEETDANGNNGKITAERFVSKVLFYLYNDVFKDYGLDQDFFKDKVDGKPIAFRSLFKMDGSLNEERVEMLLENLGVEEA